MAIGAIIITGLLGIVIYPTVIFGWHAPEFGYLAWIYLIPLFIALFSLKGTKRFFGSFVSALIFYLGSLYWLVPAMKNFGGLSLWESCGVLFLVTLILAFYFAVASSLALRVHERTGIPFFLSAAVFLMAGDFLRTWFPVNGFPWSMPAYSQGTFLSLFQWVDITGVYGLNILIYLVNGLLAEMIMAFRGRGEKDHLLNRFVVFALLGMISFFGNYGRQRGVENDISAGATVRIALVQGNIGQEMKWDPKKAMEHLRRYLSLSDRAVADGADLVIWPETAYPYTVDLSTLSSKPAFDREGLPVPILFGAVGEMPTADDEAPAPVAPPLIYNSAFLAERDARIRQAYHKQHLVPFGEYIPMKKWLTFARSLTTAVGDMTPGDKFILLETGPLKIGTLICYEDIFPDIARGFAKTGANLLVNLTNDAWYGDSSAQHQHLVFSQFRALETRRYLLRATNTGVTAVINPQGEVLYHLRPFTEDILLKGAALSDDKTLYIILGDFVGWGAAIFSVAVLFVSLFKGRTLEEE